MIINILSSLMCKYLICVNFVGVCKEYAKSTPGVSQEYGCTSLCKLRTSTEAKDWKSLKVAGVSAAYHLVWQLVRYNVQYARC